MSAPPAKRPRLESCAGAQEAAPGRFEGSTPIPPSTRPSLTAPELVPEPSSRLRDVDDSYTETSLDGYVYQTEEGLQQLEALLKTFSLQKLHAVLLDAARGDLSGNIAMVIRLHANNDKMAEAKMAEARRIISFDHHSKTAWHALNARHSGLRGSERYEVAYEVSSEIDDIFDTILAHTKPHSSYGTKKSAAETMRKIFKSVFLSNDVIGHEVRNNAFGWDETFMQVLKLFTADERERLLHENDGEWVQGKVAEIAFLAGNFSHPFYDKLQAALEFLEGYNGEDESEEDGDVEGEEKEEEDAYHGGGGRKGDTAPNYF